MIGIVIASHSAPLAEAARELALQMVAKNPPALELAAGTEDGGLGTDAAKIVEAVQRADSGDGVVVLMDLGSAVMSAEMAVEMLEPELAERTRLSPAPLVEGLVVAAVTAASGGDLDRVDSEARGGLRPKEKHLG
ncbi:MULTISPECIES: dihydroxyacetone kinase phosphoryl donor subunit DhaM [Rothia]|uniref:phosphoenolpyruvate--glycerone phosphotransferase n=1 Tax=Rothia kristinae TaxID=37923 RepID=A0A147E7G8_9MICC|nr:dihydroxyacetone kinase phosphoryl donor subunit DhaM [Rothia kristinae]MBE8526463.1 PTS-dependent dihydroxyacetone kinase phosphotransferase subunit DhaM [Amycolatopsis sp. H6(2020)]MDN5640496.1 PTS-dependent dihydroxyacetone kinase phosphotransferase subunit DhaM [Actinomycetes bacterium]TDP56505.1 dihydroxyacetone kinase phosphotransfer subunit [Kocuria sp. AG109]SIM56094.1 phosphotransferase system HPr (HPr) family protein [Mycobacteroides abscessus subsp. abscessus]KTR38040.1 dihydroxy